MGFFTNSSPFDSDVEKITDEKNKTEDWGTIMDLCDRVRETPNGAKDCLKSINKRLNHADPHVVMQSITFLDACVSNCGKAFMLEVASRDFEIEFRRLLNRSQPKVLDRLLSTLRKWAEGDFKNDSQFGLIPSLFNALKQEGVDFSGGEHKKQVLPNNPNAVFSQQEEDDIAKAIQLSLQEGGTKKGSSGVSSLEGTKSLYPNASGAEASSVSLESSVTKEQMKARALYDFEAVEDNELTFKAGEIVVILDNSDSNWWKGSNHRGEGLFPSNFVTTDLETDQAKEEKRRRSVQFNDVVEVSTVNTSNEEVEICEEKIDHVLNLLHDADPTSPEFDPPDLSEQEERVNTMGPLIDTELEVVDRRHAELTRLSTELVDALNLYHQLMREMPMMQAPHMMYGQFGPQTYLPHPYMPHQQPIYSVPPQGGIQQPGSLPNPNAYGSSAAGLPGNTDPNMFAGSAPPPTPPLSADNSLPPPHQYSSYVMGNGDPSGPVTQQAYVQQTNYPPQQIM